MPGHRKPASGPAGGKGLPDNDGALRGGRVADLISELSIHLDRDAVTTLQSPLGSPRKPDWRPRLAAKAVRKSAIHDDRYRGSGNDDDAEKNGSSSLTRQGDDRGNDGNEADEGDQSEATERNRGLWSTWRMRLHEGESSA